jgi:hypothetical protein
LIARKFDIKTTYDAIIAKQKYQIENFPYKISSGVFDLLNQGVMYIAGRDRHYRPIVVVRQYLIN